MATDILYRIEALGRDSVARQYHFSKGSAPSWDTDAVFVPGCVLKFPAEISSAVDFFSGSFTIGGLTTELIAQAETRQGVQISEFLYEQSRVAVAELTAPISTTTQTTVVLDNATLSGVVVVVGRECIKLGTYSAGVYIGSTRGVFGTSPAVHGVTAFDFKQVFRASNGPILKWRKIELCRVNLETAASYADVEVLWTGVITGIGAPVPNKIAIEADSMIAALSRATTLNEIARFGTGATGVNYRRRQYDPRIGDPADELICIDGEVVLAGLSRIQSPDGTFYEIDPRQIVTELDTFNRRQRIPSDPKEYWQVVWCNAPASAATDSYPPSSNLLTCFLQVLTTTRDGYNGAYDLGDGTDGFGTLGLGFPVQDVDITGVESIRNEFGDLLEQESMILNLDGKPVKVLEFFQQRLTPYGIVIVDKSGKISAAAFLDGASTTATLEQSEILGPAAFPARGAPAQVRRLDLQVDSATASYAAVPGFGPVIDKFVNVERRQINRFGERITVDLNLEGIKSSDRVQTILAPFLQRFNEAIPDIALTVTRLRTDLDVGDLVSVTHNKIYQRTSGARGVTAAQMLVVERTLNLAENTLQMRLLDVSALYGALGQLAPAATVQAVSGGGLKLSVFEEFGSDPLAFQSGVDPDRQYDVSTFAVGDVIQHCDPSGVFVQNLTIGSITAPTVIIVTTTPSPAVSAGDVVRLASYDNTAGSLRDLKALFAWLADSNGTLGAAGDAGKEYRY